MDRDTAETVVQSLVERLVDDQDAYRLPEGRLSRTEVSALRTLLGEYVESNPERMRFETKAALQTEINLESLEQSGPPEESLRLCLDFGTASSKACAMGQDYRETIPLVLGRYCGNGEYVLSLHGSYHHVSSVPSSIFISTTGRVFFGAAAETQHRQELESGRRRFDNLKRMLSDAEVGQELDHVPVERSIDPTCSGLTLGDLLVLYLGWLTDLALVALGDLQEKGGIPIETFARNLRCISRRFAIPCFAEAEESFARGGVRADWAEDVLRRSILRAQLVADTLQGEWEDLDTQKAKQVIDTVGRFRKPELPSVLTHTPSVREPIASGASLFDEELDELEEYGELLRAHRRLLLVVDAGAGTTDFAVFQVGSGNDGISNRKFALIGNSVQMSRIAGNAIDGLLWPLVLRACGIDPSTGAPRSDEDFFRIKADLGSKIRAIKEEIVNFGACDVELVPNAGGSLTLNDLTTDSAYLSHAGDLRSQCSSILGGLFSEEYSKKLRTAGVRVPVHVLLTGGSSKLPFVEELADTPMTANGIRFELRRVRSLPSWTNSLPRALAELVAREFSQLAVSIGGAVPALPEEVAPFDDPIEPPVPGGRTL